jgi:hypothetical protein
MATEVTQVKNALWSDGERLCNANLKIGYRCDEVKKHFAEQRDYVTPI